VGGTGVVPGTVGVVGVGEDGSGVVGVNGETGGAEEGGASFELLAVVSPPPPPPPQPAAARLIIIVTIKTLRRPNPAPVSHVLIFTTLVVCTCGDEAARAWISKGLT